MRKTWAVSASIMVVCLFSISAYSQEEMHRNLSWQVVPGTDLPSRMEPNPRPWRIGSNTITRNGDVINFDVDADGEYVRYLANCRTRMMTRILTGYLDENDQVLGVRSIQEVFFSADESPQRSLVLEYVCSQN